jgi:hypothetical protein
VYLKSGGVSAVLSGVMVSMSRLLEKQGPTLYSPECVERLSGNSYARAKRLTMSRVIAA